MTADRWSRPVRNTVRVVFLIVNILVLVWAVTASAVFERESRAAWPVYAAVGTTAVCFYALNIIVYGLHVVLKWSLDSKEPSP